MNPPSIVKIIDVYEEQATESHRIVVDYELPYTFLRLECHSDSNAACMHEYDADGVPTGRHTGECWAIEWWNSVDVDDVAFWGAFKPQKRVVFGPEDVVHELWWPVKPRYINSGLVIVEDTETKEEE